MAFYYDPPTLSNDADGQMSGEDYTKQISDTLGPIAKSAMFEIVNIAGTAISLTGNIAKDPANFTYYQGKALFFIAASNSEGTTTISIGALAPISISDASDNDITDKSWKAGDLVLGIIYNGKLRVALGVSASGDNGGTGVIAPINIYKQLVNIPSITLNSSVDEIFRFEGVQGVQGDILHFPNTTINGSDSGDSHHSINIYRDGVLIDEYIHIHSDEYAGNVTQIITNELNYGHLTGALEITDGLPHDYIFKYDGSGTYYITFRGELSITRYSGPLIDGSA